MTLLRKSLNEIFSAVMERKKAHPSVVPGLNDFLLHADREVYASETFNLIVQVHHTMRLSAEYKAARDMENFDAVFETFANRTISLAADLSRSRANPDIVPPKIPEGLKDLIPQVADIFDKSSSAPPTTCEELEDEVEAPSRSSLEIRAEILSRAFMILGSCEKLRSVIRIQRDHFRAHANVEIPKGLGAHGDLNLRMLQQAQNDPTCYAWPASKWAAFLGCSKSTVHSQPTWKTIMKIREQAKIDRIARRESERN
jgi:hypothetical protein